MGHDRLTMEMLRQRLADKVPGFVQMLAESLSMEIPELMQHVEAGNVSNFDALAALATHAIELRRELDAMEDAVEDEMPLERALHLAELWAAGKMIGGDANDVSIALLREVQRLRVA